MKILNTVILSLNKKYDRTITQGFTYYLSTLLFKIAPSFTTKLLRTKGFSTRARPLNDRQIEIHKRAKITSLFLRQNQIKVFEWGDGPVVLLAHGWSGRALQLYHFVEPLVERGYKVVAFDQKGHGESATQFSSFPECVQATQLVFDHYKPNVVAMIGHSMGGSAILKISENIPTPIQLVAVAPMGDIFVVLENLRLKMGLSELLFANVIKTIERECSVNLQTLRTANIDKIKHHHVLLVHDQNDSVNHVQTSQNLHKDLPSSELLLTNNLGHNKILNHSETLELIFKKISGF